MIIFFMKKIEKKIKNIDKNLKLIISANLIFFNKTIIIGSMNKVKSDIFERNAREAIIDKSRKLLKLFFFERRISKKIMHNKKALIIGA